MIHFSFSSYKTSRTTYWMTQVYLYLLSLDFKTVDPLVVSLYPSSSTCTRHYCIEWRHFVWVLLKTVLRPPSNLLTPR